MFARFARYFGHSRSFRRRPRCRARAPGLSRCAAPARASRACREHLRPGQVRGRNLEAAHEAVRVSHAPGGLRPLPGKLADRSACHGAAVPALRITATPRRSRAAVGGHLSGRSLNREHAVSISIDGSAKGGSDTSAGHHVGVGAVLLGVRRLGGPVVGGTWTVVEKVQSDENSVNMSQIERSAPSGTVYQNMIHWWVCTSVSLLPNKG